MKVAEIRYELASSTAKIFSNFLSAEAISIYTVNRFKSESHVEFRQPETGVCSGPSTDDGDGIQHVTSSGDHPRSSVSNTGHVSSAISYVNQVSARLSALFLLSY